MTKRFKSAIMCGGTRKPVMFREGSSPFDDKGHTRHASPDDQHYEIESDKSDHIAAHQGQVLKHA
jgi:hypothetical protein